MPRPLPGPDSNASPLAARQQAQRAIGQIGHDVKAVSRAVAPPAPRALRTGANPRGVAIQAPTGGKTLAQAVRDVFAHQDPKRQAAIVHGVIMGRTDPATNQAVTEAFHALDPRRQMEISKYFPVTASHLDIGKFLHNANPFSAANFSPSSSAGAGPGTPRGAAAIGAQSYKNLKVAGKFAENAGKDAIALGPQTIEGTYGIGKDLVEGHYTNALKDVVDPFVQMATHPLSSLYNHPLNTGMMFAAPEAALGRGIGAVARSGALGDVAKAAAGTAREPLRLGPDVAGAKFPLIEHRSYSPNVMHKAIQVAHENRLRARHIDPNVAHYKPALLPKRLASSLNVGLEAKLQRIPDEMVHGRQGEGRENRAEHMATVAAARPHKTVENVVSHILQGVIQTPKTAIEDIGHEIDRLTAADKGVRKSEVAMNRRQVKDLQLALENSHRLPEAFDAADTLRRYSHTADEYLTQRGLLDPDQAMRARVTPYAIAHMGAEYDPETKELTVPGQRQKVIPGKVTRDPKLVATLETELRAEKRIARAARNDVEREARKASPRPIVARLEKRAQLYERRAQAVADQLEQARLPTHEPARTVAFGSRRVLATHEILRDLEAKGVPDPAYVGHYAAKTAPHRFYEAWKQARGSRGSQHRTYLSFGQGSYDHSYDGLVAQAARTAEGLTKASFHDRIVNRLGIGNPFHESGYFTPAQAKRYAYAAMFDEHHQPRPDGQQLVPITAFGSRGPGVAITKELQSPHQLQHIDSVELDAMKRAVEDAASRSDSNHNVVLIPKDSYDRLQAQFKPATGMSRKIGQVTQQFKRTVLPYSTHWMTQIAAEGLLRSTLSGVLDPRNIAAGRQLMKHLKETEEGRYALREMVNASFYSSRAGDAMSKFNPDPSPTMEALRHSPVGIVIAAHNKYADFIGTAIGGMEHQFRNMGLGKLARKQIQEFTGSYQAGVRLQGKALAQLVEKLRTDPALVAKFGREIDDTFGKYNKFSPAVRGAVQTVAPFLPWYLNAAKFVLWNLPAHHPVANALLASLRVTVANDIAAGKQTPLNEFQVNELARMTPFGLWPQKPGVGGAAATALDPILPQVSSAYNVFEGRSVFGDGPLTSPSGEVKPRSSATIAPALEALAEAVLPGVAQLRKVRQDGGTPYGTSTVLDPQTKPDSGSGALKVIDRIFNPFYGFMAAAHASSGGGSGGGASTGLGDTGLGGDSGLGGGSGLSGGSGL